MVASELQARLALTRRSLVAALVVATLAFACGSSGKSADRKPVPPQAVSAVTPNEPPPSELPVATPAPPNKTVIVLDPGETEDDGTPKTLAEAARRERERRKNAPEPVAVINNKNLAQYAEGATLTVASPQNNVGDVQAPIETADGHDEEWWRNRGLEIRRRWKEAADRVDELEAQAAELRQRFYATDDPYVRDAQVKPEWDKALRELDQTRAQVEEGPHEVERFLEEGRQAGALPGWLREGVELEPTPVLPRTEGEVEPGEPKVVGDDSPRR